MTLLPELLSQPLLSLSRSQWSLLHQFLTHLAYNKTIRTESKNIRNSFKAKTIKLELSNKEYQKVRPKPEKFLSKEALFSDSGNKKLTHSKTSTEEKSKKNRPKLELFNTIFSRNKLKF